MTSIREQIKGVLEERARDWETTGKPLADLASTRGLTAEEQSTFEKAEEAFRGYDSRIKLLELSLESERQIAEFSKALGNDDAVRSAFQTELRTVLATRTKSLVDMPFTGEEVARALSTGVAAAGGNLFGKTFLDQLVIPLRQFSPLFDAGAFQFTTSGGEELILPRVSSFGAAATQAEATQLTGTDPAFDQVSIKSYKFGDYRGVSRELVEDSAVDIEGLVTRLIGENIGYLMGSKLTNGTGVGETTGVATAATVGVTGSTGVAGAFTSDNLIDLQESVLAPYQVNASWIVSNSAMAAIRKMKDGNQRYLWEPSVQIGVPSVLLGNPIYRDPYLPAVGINNAPVLYGDFSKYWVRFVNSLRVERSEHALFGSDQIAFRGVLRADGALVDVNAVKKLRGGAS